MASKPGAWYAFPWESWGNAKYAVLLPFVAAVALGADDGDNWAWHMLAIAALRYAHAACWNTLSRTHAVSAGTRITAKPVEFKQVDREANWDDYILLQVVVMSLVHNTPRLGFSGFAAWNSAGLVQLLLLHVGPTEWLYYWLHRALHWHPLYQRYHSHHHASFVAEPITGARRARRAGHAQPTLGLFGEFVAREAASAPPRLARPAPRGRPAAGRQRAARARGAARARRGRGSCPRRRLARGVARAATTRSPPRLPLRRARPPRRAAAAHARARAAAPPRLGAPVRGAHGVHGQLCNPAAGHVGGWRRVVGHVLHLPARLRPAERHRPLQLRVRAGGAVQGARRARGRATPKKRARALARACPRAAARAAPAADAPRRAAQAFPPLKYLVYTPTFHALHHSQVKTNFCLFMPLYDYVYGTADPASWTLHAAALRGEAVRVEAPHAVFLAHGTEVLSWLHLPFVCRSLSSQPWAPHPLLYLAWPLAAPAAALVAAFGRVFTADKHTLGELRLETWVTPAFGLQYFFKSQHARLNRHIASAIQAADASGVRVIGLGALNKAEALNGGGKLFVDTLPALRVRVVHGNTLTAAAILRKIPAGTRAVFLTGATSKLGRACALYLSARGVAVAMLTGSQERFDAIAAEAATPAQRALLRRCTSVAEGADCACWVVGKHLSRKEQAAAPPGATFHQFVVPPLDACRADCTYTDLPAFRLPPAARGFRSCEMTMQRRAVHACHAGALVHALEGWTHHEVGAVPHDRVDTVWEAAERHGFVMV